MNSLPIKIYSFDKNFIKNQIWKIGTKKAFLPLTYVLIFVAIFMIQISLGDFFWVGHGPNQYLYLIPNVFKDFDYLPLIPYHQDEILYGSYFYNFRGFNYNIIFFSSIVLALNKISILTFCYIFIKSYLNKGTHALLVTFFLGIGTFYLNPSKYMMYFDSNNPLVYTMHSGRILGFAIILLLFLIEQSQDIKHPNPGWVFLIFMGLSLTPISNVLIVLLYITFVFGRRFNLSRILKPIVALLSLMFTFLFSSLLYTGFRFMENFTVYRIIPVVIFLLTLICLILTSKISISQIFVKFFIPIFSAILITIGLIGNVISYNVISQRIYSLLGLYDNLIGENFMSIYNLGIFDNKVSNIDNFPSNFFKKNIEIGDWVQYNVSQTHFIYFYVVIFLISLVSLCTLFFRGVNFSPIYILIYFSTLLLFALFYYIDFVNDLERSWIKSRFLEIPFYLIFILSSISILQSRKKVVRYFYIVFLCFYSITPFLLTRRFDQILINANYLESLF
jgi:hypothetical protein